MNFKQLSCALWCVVCVVMGCDTRKQTAAHNVVVLERAQQTLDSLYQNYSVAETCLLRENYPVDTASYKATYLASEEQGNTPNKFSYLWPYSGTFSAVNALYAVTRDPIYKSMLDTKVLPGLEEYFDTRRTPAAYASYIRTAPQSDRFYDDNIWLGIDFTDTYELTKEPQYLEKAKLIWKFIESGTDEKLGGGIYWCEQKKESKNTCSNAPGSVFALKLFEATQDSSFLQKGQTLYYWTKVNLQDTTDYLYFDNIGMNGTIGRAKFAYNSGQMMQAAVILYRLTGNQQYLTDAQNIAGACHSYFFKDHKQDDGTSFSLLKKGDVWFSAVMLRGFIELYRVDKNKVYLDSFDQSMDYAWNHARDEKGLFSTDFTGSTPDHKKWLLTQAAMIEIYARLAEIK